MICFRYTLFAVVNHIGNIESGHYINYIKQGQSSWFKCDDHQITKSTLQDVLNSEGYALYIYIFYVCVPYMLCVGCHNVYYALCVTSVTQYICINPGCCECCETTGVNASHSYIAAKSAHTFDRAYMLLALHVCMIGCSSLTPKCLVFRLQTLNP